MKWYEMNSCGSWIAGLLYIYIFYILKCTTATKEKDLLKCHIYIPIFFMPLHNHSWSKYNTDFCHVRPTSVTCSLLSSPAMVPYVCQNVYAVCFFQPDLFLCLLSNEPRSPRGSELKPHAIYTDWTAGALLAKEVWVGERNYYGRFRLNQALDNSLF